MHSQGESAAQRPETDDCNQVSSDVPFQLGAESKPRCLIAWPCHAVLMIVPLDADPASPYSELHRCSETVQLCSWLERREDEARELTEYAEGSDNHLSTSPQVFMSSPVLG